jgi:hypothetical protein
MSDAGLLRDQQIARAGYFGHSNSGLPLAGWTPIWLTMRDQFQKLIGGSARP